MLWLYSYKVGKTTLDVLLNTPTYSFKGFLKEEHGKISCMLTRLSEDCERPAAIS